MREGSKAFANLSLTGLDQVSWGMHVTMCTVEHFSCWNVNFTTADSVVRRNMQQHTGSSGC
jgi:hypothetical protein